MGDESLLNADASADVELARLLADIGRAGWRITLLPKANEWGATVEASLTFVRIEAPPRTLREDIAALSEGLPTYAPIHYRVNLLEPETIIRAVRLHHQRFVAARPHVPPDAA